MAYKHGLRQHKLYGVWCNIKQRCNNIKDKEYHCYGGRGIKIADYWQSNPKLFIEEMIKLGWREGLQIDRINNNGNYERNNIQFITQAKNKSKRSNVELIIAFGEIKTIVEWVNDFRCIVSYNALFKRIKRGISPEIAMMTPLQRGIKL